MTPLIMTPAGEPPYVVMGAAVLTQHHGTLWVVEPAEEDGSKYAYVTLEPGDSPPLECCRWDPAAEWWEWFLLTHEGYEDTVTAGQISTVNRNEAEAAAKDAYEKWAAQQVAP